MVVWTDGRMRKRILGVGWLKFLFMHFLCQKSQVISTLCLRAVRSYFFSIVTETYHRLSNLILRLFWSNSQHSALSSSDVMQGKSEKAKYSQRSEGDKAARYSKKFSEERVAPTPFPPFQRHRRCQQLGMLHQNLTTK